MYRFLASCRKAILRRDPVEPTSLAGVVPGPSDRHQERLGEGSSLDELFVEIPKKVSLGPAKASGDGPPLVQARLGPSTVLPGVADCESRGTETRSTASVSSCSVDSSVVNLQWQDAPVEVDRTNRQCEDELHAGRFVGTWRRCTSPASDGNGGSAVQAEQMHFARSLVALGNGEVARLQAVRGHIQLEEDRQMRVGDTLLRFGGKAATTAVCENQLDTQEAQISSTGIDSESSLEAVRLNGFWRCNIPASTLPRGIAVATWAQQILIDCRRVVLGSGEVSELQVRDGQIFLEGMSMVRVSDRRLMRVGKITTLVYEKVDMPGDVARTSPDCRLYLDGGGLNGMWTCSARESYLPHGLAAGARRLRIERHVVILGNGEVVTLQVRDGAILLQHGELFMVGDQLWRFGKSSIAVYNRKY
eukprot:TRINITY_DN31948_c0_g1_i2.p1 TRINITY_DN31948_c0_g1~~TRINITY_DN31948_c0_g1_i2.p1  ORF type:complete len:418 (-),score=40.28 TRINITY_DN31948_c0_g1_i2:207-1460(-)